MGSEKLGKYGIGCVIADCLLVIDLAIDIFSGQLTWHGLLMLIVLSVFMGALMFSLIKRMRKNRKRTNTK